MALNSVPLPYGLRDVSLKSFTDASWSTPGPKVDLPYARTLSFTESEDFETLRGDDKVVTTRGKGPSIAWELEAGGISLDALAMIAGGTVVTTGVTPTQVKTYRKKTSDARPYFKAEGQSISDSGGDFHGVVYRCRATGDITGTMGDGVFWLTNAKGDGLGSFEAAYIDALYDLIQNESVTANV